MRLLEGPRPAIYARLLRGELAQVSLIVDACSGNRPEEQIQK